MNGKHKCEIGAECVMVDYS